MKKIIVSIITLLLLGSVTEMKAQRVIEQPGWEFRNNGTVAIDRIELDKEQTRLYVKCSYKPRWWIMFNDKSYLRNVDTGEKYYVKAIEGTEFGKETFMPESGDSSFVLVFPALNPSVKKVDWANDDPTDWAVYGIPLVKPKVAAKQNALALLKGNWLKTDGSNDWTYSFYDSLAIADNQFWKYNEIRKKGKHTYLTLSNDSGTKTLVVKEKKDGTCLIGPDEKNAFSFSKNKTTNPLYKPAGDTAFSSTFFSVDSAYIHGYLDGYDLRAGFSTGIIYMGNVLTREDYPVVVQIYPDGHFEAALPMMYPIHNSINFEHFWIPFYIEPGQTLMMYLKWEDFLTAKRTQDRTFAANSEDFMGPLAHINKELLLIKEADFNYNTFQNELKTVSPADYKTKAMKIYQTRLDSLEVLYARMPVSAKAKKILKLEEQVVMGSGLFDFLMYREFASRENPDNEILKLPVEKNYYNFLKQVSVNEPLLLTTKGFSTFINRFEYMDLFNEKSRTIFLSPEKTFVQYAKEQNIKLTPEEIKVSDYIDMFIGKPLPLEDEMKTYREYEKKHGELRKKYQVSYSVYQEKYVAPLFKQDNYVDSEYKTWQKRDSIIADLLNMPVCFTYDVAKVRSFDFAFGCMKRDEALTYLSKMNKSIQDPFLQKEGERIFLKRFPDKVVAYTLPEGKATDIFRRMVNSQKGKYVLVDFWATTCGPCCGGIKQMRPIREKYTGSKDLAFVYITDEASSPLGSYNKFVTENAMGDNLNRISVDDYNYLRQLFKFNGIPRYVLLDREGNVVDDDFPAHNLESELTKLFKTNN